MFRQFLLISTLFFSIQVLGQTGIGTTTPHASAKLEVAATDKGFLPPRVTLNSVTDASTIPSPATGLLVYNNGSVGLQAGYYYWNGASWATIATASSPNQTVDYVSVTRTSLQTVSVGDNILFNQINGGNIPYNSSTGLFTLTAGKTYRLTGCIAMSSSNASAEEVNVVWKNANGDLLANKGEILSTNFGTTGFANGIADIIYTPSVNTTVSLTVAYSSGSVILWGNFTYANIQQIGSSAIINPWVLSGNNVYNTSGNVGIGTTTPTQALDVNGNVNVTGKINLTDPSGNVATKVSGLVNAGTFLSLDNLKVSVTTGGSRGLSVGAVTTNFTANISAYYAMNGGVAGSAVANVAYTTTPSGAAFGWSFPSESDGSYYNILDKTNNRMYRVTLIIGASYFNNFISIERLL